MATNRPTGDLIELLDVFSKGLRKVKSRLRSHTHVFSQITDSLGFTDITGSVSDSQVPESAVTQYGQPIHAQIVDVNLNSTLIDVGSGARKDVGSVFVDIPTSWNTAKLIGVSVSGGCGKVNTTNSISPEWWLELDESSGNTVAYISAVFHAGTSTNNTPRVVLAIDQEGWEDPVSDGEEITIYCAKMANTGEDWEATSLRGSLIWQKVS